MDRKNRAKRQTKTKNNRTTPAQEIDELVDKLLKISTVPTQNVAKALELQEEIHSLTQKVIEAETGESVSQSIDTRCSSATIERFTDWVKTNGAVFEGSQITEFKGYDLGLKANIDIPQDSLIIAIPRKLMLTLEAAGNSSLGPLIERDQILKNMSNVALAIFLLFEKSAEDSFWKPYLDILPSSYSTVLYFTPDELRELHGSPTLELALKQIKSITRQYAYFHKLFRTSSDPVCKLLKKSFTYNRYRWAVSTVMTRQNTIPSKDGSKMVNALIPLWDLCNHTNGTISTDYNPELDRSECLALRDFKAGEQLFIFYGPRSNADLFIHNGFVYEDNVHDGYWLHLGISKSDPLENKRGELLNKLSLPMKGDFWITKADDPIDAKLIAFLRVFSMNEDQLKKTLEYDKYEHLLGLECDLDPALEQKTWTFLVTRLKLLLAAYKTTLEADLKSVSDGKLSPNAILSVRMRITEKMILKNAIDYVQQRISAIIK